jgi:hypothetical protein
MPGAQREPVPWSITRASNPRVSRMPQARPNGRGARRSDCSVCQASHATDEPQTSNHGCCRDTLSRSAHQEQAKLAAATAQRARVSAFSAPAVHIVSFSRRAGWRQGLCHSLPAKLALDPTVARPKASRKGPGFTGTGIRRQPLRFVLALKSL